MTTEASSIRAVQVTGGCQLITHVTPEGEDSYLFGCVSEAIKFFVNQRLNVKRLRGIVLTDTTHVNGVSNWALEFPFYKQLFVDKGYSFLPPTFKAGKVNWKLVILGTASQVRRAREILRITYRGPTKAEFKRWGTPRKIGDMLLGPMNYFALKGEDGNVLAVDDLVEFRTFDENARAVLPSGLEVLKDEREKDLFHVSVGGQTIATTLDFTRCPEPPYAIAMEQRVEDSARLSFRVLSYSNGFDSAHGCTSLGLWINGLFFLWDCTPFVVAHLRAHGISVGQIAGVFLSHVHDDHGCLLEIILQGGGRKLKVITTREIYESMLIKLGALLDLDPTVPAERRDLEEHFELVEVKCGESETLRDFYGAEVEFFYTVHSIPTIGARFTVGSNGERRSILLSSDTAGPAKLKELCEAGAISKRWFDDQWPEHLIRENETMAIWDGGGDPAELHPDPNDPMFAKIARSMKGRLLFGHRGSLSPELVGAGVELAEAGKIFTLLDGYHHYTDGILLRQVLLSIGVRDEDAITALTEQGKVLPDLPPGSPVILEGQEESPEFYLVLRGALVVELGSGRSVSLERGDFFGEVAILTGGKRNATVRTVGPSRLLALPADVFGRFALKHKLLPVFQKLWERRADLASVGLFKELPPKTMRALANQFEVQDLGPSTTIVTQGGSDDDLYVIVNGTVEVRRDGNVIAHLGPATVVGEVNAIGLADSRTATVVTESACKVYRMKGEDFRTFIRNHPKAREVLRVTLRERRLAAAVPA